MLLPIAFIGSLVVALVLSLAPVAFITKVGLHLKSSKIFQEDMTNISKDEEEEKEDVVCTPRYDKDSYPLQCPRPQHERIPSFSAPSYHNRRSLYDFSAANADIMRMISSSRRQVYNFDQSTQENYSVENDNFYGEFQEIRASLDRVYHGNYSQERQELQDMIVHKMLDGVTVTDNETGSFCKTPTEPWIVFTAGVMGAGKSHTMKHLSTKGLFPLEAYVVVDPDEIRSHFPEYHLYAQSNPERAGELTNREAGYVTEIVTAAALRCGHNVLVDGSLRDYEWYKQFFVGLRKEYVALRIAILHITAPREVVFERAEKRARTTGRVVPIESLEKSLEQVPISVKKLAPLADFFCELDNSYNFASNSGSEVRMITEGISWDAFRENWAQTCPWVPPSNLPPSTIGEDIFQLRINGKI